MLPKSTHVQKLKMITYGFYPTLIVFLAFLLRFLLLDKVPPALCCDEAKFGLHGYSIAETLRHETGEFLPVYFRIYGNELANPIFYYLTALIIKITRPELIVPRLVSCLLGTLSVFLTYKLTKLYFSRNMALLAAFLLAISPWHIQISRVAMEHVTFTVFFVWALYLFSLGLKNENKYIIYSSFPLALSFYTYQSARLFVPLFALFFFMLNLKQIAEKKRVVIVCIIISLVLLYPCITKTLSGELQSRFLSFSITHKYYLKEQREKFSESGFSFLTKNDKTLIIAAFVNNYFIHMSTDFLLKTGDRNLRHHVGGRGQILWFTFWMMIAGLLQILITGKKELYIFPIWFLLFPVPAAMTGLGLPHAGRAICGLPVFEILGAVGFFSLLAYGKKLSKTRFREAHIFVYIALVVFIFNGAKDLKNYFTDYFGDYIQRSKIWFEHDVLPISKATEYMKEYDAIIMPPINFCRSQILYFQKIHPKIWQVKGYKLRYVSNLPFIYVSQNKKIARIVLPGQYSSEKTIGHVYDDYSGKLIYEIKKVNVPKLREKKDFKPVKIGGLKGEYFNSINFIEPAVTRIDNAISFDFGEASPHNLISNDVFSIRWSGWLNVTSPGLYKFITQSDDGVRLYIDSAQVIDNWTSHSATTDEANIKLEAGWHIIVLEYYEDSGGSIIDLKWQVPNGIQEHVPSKLLSPDSIFLG